MSFTKVPEAYYVAIEKEFPELPISLMKEANILCEKDGDKLLLQDHLAKASSHHLLVL